MKNQTIMILLSTAQLSTFSAEKMARTDSLEQWDLKVYVVKKEILDCLDQGGQRGLRENMYFWAMYQRGLREIVEMWVLKGHRAQRGVNETLEMWVLTGHRAQRGVRESMEM